MGLAPRATLAPPPFSTAGMCGAHPRCGERPIGCSEHSLSVTGVPLLVNQQGSRPPQGARSRGDVRVAAGWGRTAVRSMSPAGRGTKAAAGARPLPLWASESPGPVSHPGTTVETVVPTARGGHRGERRVRSPVPGLHPTGRLSLRGWEPGTGELPRRRWKGPLQGGPGQAQRSPGRGGRCLQAATADLPPRLSRLQDQLRSGESGGDR